MPESAAANQAGHADDLADFVLRIADDALVHAQRLCEWCAAAPLLEEDIAIANTGLDYLGRARMAYQYAGELLGQTEDELAYLRDATAYKNLLIVELPRGDFAFALVRQYLLDQFEYLYFAQLQNSADQTLAAIAVKTHKEVIYHLRRSSEWMRRLGLGTAESNQRSQQALDELWGYVDEFFLMDALEQRLSDASIAVDRQVLRENWQNAVTHLIKEVSLTLPESAWQVSGGRKGIHTEHLGHMLAQMQFLQRAYPGLQW